MFNFSSNFSIFLGGAVDADSNPARGSTLSVYLPTTELELPFQLGQTQQELAGTETILIIDDEEEIVEMLEQLLEMKGYPVIKARTGQRGIDIAQNYNDIIHLAILDMGMPGLSGAETLPSLVETRPDTQSIICSGYGIDAESQSLLCAGATAILHKPIKATNLLGEIRRIIDSK